LDSARTGRENLATNGADEGFQALLVMNSDTGQGVAIMADSDNGILVADEYLRSLAREYHWKYPAPAEIRRVCKWRCWRGFKGLDAAFGEV